MSRRRWVLGCAGVGCLTLLAGGSALVWVLLSLPSMVFDEAPLVSDRGTGADPIPIRERAVKALRETGEVRLTAEDLNTVFPQSDKTRCAFAMTEQTLDAHCGFKNVGNGEAEPNWVHVRWQTSLDITDGRVVRADTQRLTVGQIPVHRMYPTSRILVDVWADPGLAEYTGKIRHLRVEDGQLFVAVTDEARATIRGPGEAAPPSVNDEVDAD